MPYTYPASLRPTRLSPHTGRHLCLLTAALFLAGCKKKPAEQADAAPPPAPPAPTLISDIDLKSFKPNEAGAILVIMYHRFNPKESNNPLNRTPDEFRKDLETLWKKKYYPVNANEMVENKMDVPAGKTPVVLTFDDALPTQFKTIVRPDGSTGIDPDCAVGILEKFHEAHKDEWPMKATFFVLPAEGRNGPPFGQSDSLNDKFDYLISKGYEVANHTSTHTSMRGMAPDKVKWELATANRDIHQINKDAQMQTLALPYGNVPRREKDKDAAVVNKLLLDGEDKGTKYHHIAVFRAAWRPVLSPITKTNNKKYTANGQLSAFDPTRIERCTPDPKQANVPGTLEFWLKYFDEHPDLRYVSDGNPNIAAFPKSWEGAVDKKRLEAQGKIAQAYTFGSSGTGGRSGGSGLSVDNRPPR